MCCDIKSKIDTNIKSYFLGFLFSFILTIVPFLLVINKIFSSNTNYIICLLCAIIQIFVHFIYFLHLNFSEEKKWNVISLLFVIIIIFIIVFGSTWIMHHLNHYNYHTIKYAYN
ncbi:cytochrome o ubiquinol oxidase subunit IV [Buchnera aphidicola]|uniref:Cytochrome bo(3) ubiquinol oxidase subunit 4 n=1 Tax=Buchnera aphidicola str. Ua (Uroleucon ambrosiae) TaxID=1005057 RepID=G2LPV6_BUCUM|nr:cytochrome o ubiquinol oxidase subunit IV [Buchnera aphidicola]AEO08243.1 cytochrome O ubiquinol oxidase subunit IV [Buchnera aphidicola str. Ua (Uroleucon ambrosiae)]